ncbi:helix-turn-helix domain-containing protein [Rathayibacter tanaceti]|uniref:Helix-turn-helix domain protein n=2 Tax=Rathayibacter tanaceti TaxID=1671680 RepID=A0A162FY96_9MICO|nr:helix-turn-helix domain-containing protein [Rathayibacter tanaceti]KZX21320.1 Helix-turn-helix domain protein [Rathayibacter tanaceti]QHC54283.1 helix-turn-helix domain-containing protein [Rathayibacter tanaceti]TCO37961.1 AraC-like DNA-binding protein [Rathayibacter tanaceti]
MRIPESPEPVGEHGLALTGSEAAEWLRSSDLRPLGPAGDLRLFGDAIQEPGFRIARFWHNARRLERAHDAAVTVTLIVEGAVTASVNCATATARAGEGLIQYAATSITLDSDGPCGVVEMRVAPGYFERFWVEANDGLTVVPADLPSVRALLATAMAVLTAPTETSDGWPYLRGTLENALGAVLTDVGPALSLPASTGVLRRARALILRRRSQPDFDVRALAAELSISTSALHAAFARIGTTPLRAIRAARAAAAREILERRPSSDRADVDEVARLTGFGTSAKMLKALRAEATAHGRPTSDPRHTAADDATRRAASLGRTPGRSTVHPVRGHPNLSSAAETSPSGRSARPDRDSGGRTSDRSDGVPHPRRTSRD